MRTTVVKTLPSYVFAGLGVALTVCGLLGVIWGDGAATKFVSGLVLVIGLVQIFFGGIRRTEEAAHPHVMSGPGV
jgi:putative Ca2+/H+ antiporter (TMEM165/GDT1 family)